MTRAGRLACLAKDSTRKLRGEVGGNDESTFFTSKSSALDMTYMRVESHRGSRRGCK